METMQAPADELEQLDHPEPCRVCLIPSGMCDNQVDWAVTAFCTMCGTRQSFICDRCMVKIYGQTIHCEPCRRWPGLTITKALRMR